MPDDDRRDFAPLDIATKAIFDPFREALVEQATAFRDAGIPVTFTAGIKYNGAVRFQAGPDGKPIALLDTDERGTRAAEFSVELNGLPPVPKLD
jgi:hypothetical protein